MLYLFPFRNFHILEVRADRLRKLPMNMELQTFTKFRNMSFCRNFGADIEKYHIIFFSQRDKLFGYRMSIILDRLNTEPWHVQGAFEMCFRIWKWLFVYYYALAFLTYFILRMCNVLLSTACPISLHNLVHFYMVTH